MKTLVVFYSRTGITRKVAETIARALSGDVEEIVAREDRSDFSGYGLSREEAVLKKSAAIKATKKDPARYDLTIVGKPIWVQTVSSPMRAYISRKRERFTRVAFFCTQDHQGAESAFEEMQELCKATPAATVEILHKDVEDNSYVEKIESFLARIGNLQPVL
jgi:flavodoxin